jgi:outer membrane protein assembly factor BamB
MLTVVPLTRWTVVLSSVAFSMGGCNTVFSIDEVHHKPTLPSSGGSGGNGGGGGCGGSGSCGLPTGEPCDDGALCQSGHCVDGRCCDAACDGPCRACDVVGSLGTCSPHAAGTDPEQDCEAMVGCNGAGQCGGGHFWSKSFGDNDQDEERCDALAVAENGDIFITGSFEGTAAFGDPALASAGSTDIFVASFDGAGEPRWNQRFGDADAQVGLAIAIDGSGNIVVAGEFDGTLQLPGQPALTSTSSMDIFLAKLTPAGDVLWAEAFHGFSGKVVHDLAIAQADEIVLVGAFLGTLELGGPPLVSAGLEDVFVARFTPNGTPVWSQRFGDTGQYDQARAVAATSDGGVIVAGTVTGNVDFGGGLVSGLGGMDAFIVKLDSDGGYVWGDRFGSADDQIAEGVAIDPTTGDILVTGDFMNSIDFGGDTLATASAADPEVFLARLGPDGAHQWSKKFGGTNGQKGRRVVAHTSGHIALSGRFNGSLDLGGGLLSSPGMMWTMFLGQYDEAGNHLWSKGFGDWIVEIEAMDLDNSGALVVGGWYLGTLDFGGGSIGGSAGFFPDAFLAKLGP